MGSDLCCVQGTGCFPVFVSCCGHVLRFVVQGGRLGGRERGGGSDLCCVQCTGYFPVFVSVPCAMCVGYKEQSYSPDTTDNGNGLM